MLKIEKLNEEMQEDVITLRAKGFSFEVIANKINGNFEKSEKREGDHQFG